MDLATFPPLLFIRRGARVTVGDGTDTSVPRSVPGSTEVEPGGHPRTALSRQPPITYSAAAVTRTTRSTAKPTNSRRCIGVGEGSTRPSVSRGSVIVTINGLAIGSPGRREQVGNEGMGHPIPRTGSGRANPAGGD